MQPAQDTISPAGHDRDNVTRAADPEQDDYPEKPPSLIHQSNGVTRIEAVYREAKSNRKTYYLVVASVFVCAWAYSLDSSTTNNYAVDVSSYYEQHSSVLATLGIATSIIGAVCKPFIAKISDITARPYTYLLVLAFYVLGYVVAASSTSIAGYVVGEAFVAIGSNGLDLVNDIIVGDLTPLEWRGFVGSILSTPFIVNTWFAGKIVEALRDRGQWRWGYGMFAIIMPVALGPAVATLIYLDRKAKRDGIINIASSRAARRALQGQTPNADATDAEGETFRAPWSKQLSHALVEIDAFGLILLGFGWTLFLLPFSLKTYAAGGWRNASMISMMVVGGVLLICYFIYELKWSKVPSSPRRLIFNKTFIMAIVIDAFYFLAGNMRSLYWSSYVLIAKPWSSAEWVYYNNTLTLSLCVFGVVAGLLQRWTHRYKMIQIVGLCIKIIGIAISLDGRRATINTAPMVISFILVGAGGAFSVVGSRVASQAAVPHQDMALAISLLSLWSRLGGAIGSAIVAVIWADQMPRQLRAALPASATEADVRSIFNNLAAVRTRWPIDHPMRVGAIEAYRNALFYCIAPAVGLAFVPLIAACFQTNFYLGKQQNAVTDVGNDGLELSEEDKNPAPLPPATTSKEKFLRFWDGRR